MNANTSKAPGMTYAAFRVFDLSLTEMLWSRRTVFMALVVGLPVVIAVVVRLLVDLNRVVRWNAILMPRPSNNRVKQSSLNLKISKDSDAGLMRTMRAS